MTNEKGAALMAFTNNYTNMLQKIYGTEELDEAKVKETINELNSIEDARKAGRKDETRDLSPQE